MNDFDPFAEGIIERSVDSTEAQREIWLVVKFGGDQASLAYNESVTLELGGEVDADLLRRSADSLVARHDALRSTFSNDGQIMIVNEEPSLVFEIEDLRQLSDIEKQSQRMAAREDEVQQVFDLEKGPLIRFRLLNISDERHDLILTAHHIVCDGWSLGVLVEELGVLCATGGTQGPEMQAAPSFVDHAMADREALYGKKADTAELYWCDLLGEQPVELDLPTDRSRVNAMIDVDGILTRDLAALRLDRNLNTGLTKAANDAAKKSGAGLSALLLAVFAILLRRISGQEDFVIGVPAAAQAYTGQYGLVGHCVQLLPIRIQCDGDMTVAELAKSIKTSLLDGFENQGLTYGALLQRLRLQRDTSRIPLIPVMFNLDQACDNPPFGEYDMALISNPRVAENFDIFLNITPQQDQLTLESTFRTGLFDNDTIHEWLESYELTLANSVSQLECRIDDIVSLSEKQRNQQLRVWNDTLHPVEPAGATVLSRIAANATRHPERIAVEDYQESLSFRELLHRADLVASELIAAGVPAGANIGICHAPGTNLIAGLLGIWKAQCAYVPLDPDYPADRLRSIIQDANVTLILGEGNAAPEFASACEWITANGKSKQVHDVASREPRPADTAYIIHTSGSTGQPKGVVVEHAALDNLISAMARQPGMDSEGTLLAVTSLSFDISTLEIFLPLAIGAKVVVASREQVQDSFALARLLDECGADYMQATPSGWHSLLDTGWNGDKNLTALCGGEALPLPLAQNLASKVGTLWNMYGPTEATVWSTIEPISKNPKSVTIGRPIDNTTALVLDAQFRLLPPGATGGELFLGGAGLAQGYIGQPELTAERFPDNPYTEIPGDRLYRTGDLARLDVKGRIHILGRNDNQIKIRGYRVELNEVENVLSCAAGVSVAVVVVRIISEGDSRLVAYVTPEHPNTLDPQTLFELLQSKLPPQSVPQHIVILNEMPQTANGKIDRNALPDPIDVVKEKPVELTSKTQKYIAKLWCDLLRVNEIGSQDDFFLLGGHSMLAVRMLARIRETFSLELPLLSVFQDRNVANLAARIDLLLMQKHTFDNPPKEDTEIFEF